MKKVDFIVVGLGLAGACLALQCRKRGKEVMIFDCPDKNRASSVAAGLFSPITGKNMVKTWKADILFSYLEKFYRDMEQFLQGRFFYSVPIYKPFTSIGEQNECLSKCTDPTFEKYIIEAHARPQPDHPVHDPLGGIQLAHCGHIDTKSFLSHTRALFQGINSYCEEKLEEGELEISAERIRYRDIQAEKIIFCTGIHMLSGRYFKNLPLRPLKGETLHIDTDVPIDQIYNRGVYIVGKGTPQCVLGATYNLQDMTPAITENGKMELVEKAKKLLIPPFKIRHQNWGIRPTTIDRKPLIGAHPVFKNILSFNGLGTKGASLAPWFSWQLAQFLEGTGELEKEIDIDRFMPPC